MKPDVDEEDKLLQNKFVGVVRYVLREDAGAPRRHHASLSLQDLR